MEIKIITKKKLNSCWSALQYTNQCCLCDKITTCNINSIERKNGLKNYKRQKIKDIKQKYQKELNKIKNINI